MNKSASKARATRKANVVKNLKKRKNGQQPQADAIRDIITDLEWVTQNYDNATVSKAVKKFLKGKTGYTVTMSIPKWLRDAAFRGYKTVRLS